MATTDEEKKWNSGLISLMKAAEFMKRRDGFPAPDDGPLDEEEMTARGMSLNGFCCATKATFASSHKPSAPGSKLAWTQRHAKTSDIQHVHDKDSALINLAARAACPQDGDDTTIPATLMTSLLMHMFVIQSMCGGFQKTVVDNARVSSLPTRACSAWKIQPLPSACVLGLGVRRLHDFPSVARISLWRCCGCPEVHVSVKGSASCRTSAGVSSSTAKSCS